MPRISQIDFPELPRIAQINSFYCGPATLSMLADYKGYEISQEQVVAAAGLTKREVAKDGVTVEQLAKAARELLPGLSFWGKREARMADLAEMVNVYHTPMGVEWQGVFDYPDEEIQEDEDDDPGHISIVTHVEMKNNLVRIADPDIHYAGRDRIFTIMQFELRWWDLNKGELSQHAMFTLTDAWENYPERVGMEKW